jgi:hypothetical protein
LCHYLTTFRRIGRSTSGFDSKHVAVIELAEVSILETKVHEAFCDIAVEVVGLNTTSTIGVSVAKIPWTLTV